MFYENEVIYAHFSRYLIPPPPTAATSMLEVPAIISPIPETKPRTPTPSRPPSSQVDDVLTDLLNRISIGFRKGIVPSALAL